MTGPQDTPVEQPGLQIIGSESDAAMCEDGRCTVPGTTVSTAEADG